MAFGQKVTVEDLKNLGLDPDQIKAIKDKIDGIDVAKLGNLDKVPALETTLNEIKDGLAALTQKVASTSTVQKSKENNDDPPREEEPDFILDPAGATKKVVASTVTPLVNTVAHLQAEANYNNFKNSNPRGFAKLEKEIKEIWDKQPLGNRQDPKLIENIYLITLGKHADEIASEPRTFFVEPPRGNTPNNNEPKKTAAELLSDDEKKVADSWGVSYEDYLKEKQGGSVTYA